MAIISKKQRYFFAWFEGLSKRVPQQPLILKRTVDTVVFTFEGSPSIIEWTFEYDGDEVFTISAIVSWENQFWDYLYDEEVSVARSDGLYYCALCLAERPEKFETRRELLEKHLFGVFEHWLNVCYFSKTHLLLYSLSKRYACARLSVQPECAKLSAHPENERKNDLMAIVPLYSEKI